MFILLLSLFYITRSSGRAYNEGDNILRLLDILPSFPFTTSETKRGY